MAHEKLLQEKRHYTEMQYFMSYARGRKVYIELKTFSYKMFARIKILCHDDWIWDKEILYHLMLDADFVFCGIWKYAANLLPSQTMCPTHHSAIN